MPQPPRRPRIAAAVLSAAALSIALLALPARVSASEPTTPPTELATRAAAAQPGGTLAVNLAILALGGLWLALAARHLSHVSAVARQPAATGR